MVACAPLRAPRPPRPAYSVAVAVRSSCSSSSSEPVQVRQGACAATGRSSRGYVFGGLARKWKALFRRRFFGTCSFRSTPSNQERQTPASWTTSPSSSIRPRYAGPDGCPSGGSRRWCRRGRGTRCRARCGRSRRSSRRRGCSSCSGDARVAADPELAEIARTLVGVERLQEEVLVRVGARIVVAPRVEAEPDPTDFADRCAAGNSENEIALRRFLDRTAVVHRPESPPGEEPRSGDRRATVAKVRAGRDDAHLLGRVEADRLGAHLPLGMSAQSIKEARRGSRRRPRCSFPPLGRVRVSGTGRTDPRHLLPELRSIARPARPARRRRASSPGIVANSREFSRARRLDQGGSASWGARLDRDRPEQSRGAPHPGERSKRDLRSAGRLERPAGSHGGLGRGFGGGLIRAASATDEQAWAGSARRPAGPLVVLWGREEGERWSDASRGSEVMCGEEELAGRPRTRARRRYGSAAPG